jgi:hypothetical protein
VKTARSMDPYWTTTTFAMAGGAVIAMAVNATNVWIAVVLAAIATGNLMGAIISLARLIIDLCRR